MNIYEIKYKNNFEIDNFKDLIDKHKNAKSIEVACKGLDEDTMDEILKASKQIISENIKGAEIILSKTIDGVQKNDDIKVKIKIKEV